METKMPAAGDVVAAGILPAVEPVFPAWRKKSHA
jgi:hypothetical protein